MPVPGLFRRLVGGHLKSLSLRPRRRLADVPITDTALDAASHAAQVRAETAAHQRAAKIADAEAALKSQIEMTINPAAAYSYAQRNADIDALLRPMQNMVVTESCGKCVPLSVAVRADVSLRRRFACCSSSANGGRRMVYRATWQQLLLLATLPTPDVTDGEHDR